MDIRSFAVLAAAAAAAGCASDPVEPARPDPPEAAVWYAGGVASVPLPALVAESTANGLVVQTYLDSAEMEIEAGGGYALRAWFSSYRSGLPLSRAAAEESGTWEWSDTAYVFRSTGGRLAGTMRDPALASQSFSVGHPAGAADIEVTLGRTRPAPVAFGDWRADAVREQPVPQTMYVFTDSIDGREITAHFVLDSARFGLYPTGSYVHVVWYSEWHETAGGPRELRVRYYHGDFGMWTRTGQQLDTESGWIQNHRMTGNFSGNTVLRIQHGLSPGDELVSVRYAH